MATGEDNPPYDPASEMVVIVDDHNNVVGAARRSEMRRRGLPHRSTYILVFNSREELCVQKRTTTKDVYPGYFDPAAGGVVLEGETYEESASRELFEELGIRAPLTRHFEFYFADEVCRVWGAVFSCVWEGKLTPQPEEIESVVLLPVPEVFRLARTQPFTPDGLYVLRRYLDERTP